MNNCTITLLISIAIIQVAMAGGPKITDSTQTKDNERPNILLTKYTTSKEDDPHFSASPTTSTTYAYGGITSYYYITSTISAKADFLASLALEGYGYTANKSKLLHVTSRTSIPAPNPLPNPKYSGWNFYNVTIDSVGGVPQGNNNNNLTSNSSAIVRKSKLVGYVLRDKASFSIKSHPELGTRIADDTVSADKGNRHIDLYYADATYTETHAFTLPQQTIIVK